MRRRAAKIDVNQPEIVEYLRDRGCTVQILSPVGKGCPDLLVGYEGRNYLLEVKPWDAAPHQQRLTDDEAYWHQCWKGEVAIVLNPTQAWAAIVGPLE